MTSDSNVLTSVIGECKVAVDDSDWSKSLVVKKVIAMRARAPIWCVRVQGVAVGCTNSLFLMLPICWIEV